MKYKFAPKVNYWIYPALVMPTELDNKIEQFMQCFYKATGTNDYMVKGKSRKQEHVIHRQLAMYLVYSQFDVSYAIAGKYFNKDHATVMYAERMVKNALDVDKNYINYFTRVINYMKENYLDFKLKNIYSQYLLVK